MILFSLGDVMRVVNSWNLLFAAKVFGGLGFSMTPDLPMADGPKGGIRKMAEVMRADCAQLGLRTSWASAGRLLTLCEKEGATYKEFSDLCSDEFFQRLADELSATPVFAVAPEYAPLLSTPNLFGNLVADVFPDGITDIEEAGKCIAFGRGTASVFHSMRVMELGLRKLAKELGVPYAPSWESYITQIQARITAKHKTKGVKWKRDQPYFTEILGNLVTVKIAWRNPTMHVRRTYSVEEASEVFNAVRGLMQRIAAHGTVV